MTLSQRDSGDDSQSPIPVATIVTMVGKGMTAREILGVFPELSPDDVRVALLRAADIVTDSDASLSQNPGDGRFASHPWGSVSDDEAAMELAVRETRAARRAKGGGR